MLEAFGIDIVGARERVHLFGRSIAAEIGMQLVADRLAIEQRRDFEAAELETKNPRLQGPLHRCRHGRSPLFVLASGKLKADPASALRSAAHATHALVIPPAAIASCYPDRVRRVGLAAA